MNRCWKVCWFDGNKMRKKQYFKRKNAVHFAEMLMDSIRLWKEDLDG